MKVVCNICQSDIPNESINVSTDLAQCNYCGSVLILSDLFKRAVSVSNTVSSRPPQGSKIECHEEFNGTIQLTYPKKGLSIEHIPILIFAIVWLGFVSFWTIMVIQGMPLFALFSIPFWLVGGVLIFGIINSASEKEVVTVDRKMIRLEKKRLFRSKIDTLDWSEVHGIQLAKVDTKSFSNLSRLSKIQNGMRAGFGLPGVLSAHKTYYFFEKATHAEQDWAIAFLNQKWENNK